ncbi:MAG: aldose 1-epimerase family protein [Planctomycetales bacterium]|nr:aldose 1-epimerase family protein [Planctomycetales bacterium]
MPVKSWVITDLAEGKHETDLEGLLGKSTGALPAGVTVAQRTWRGGLSDGVDEIRINNGRFQFSVLPTRGMGLWKGWIGGRTVGWKSPVRGPVHPQFVPLHEPSGLGWLDGFDEWVCRCGALSNGAPDFNEQGQLTYPLHGRLANTPAHYVELRIEDDVISLRGVVTEARFHFQKLQLTTTITTRVNQPGLEILDEVKNLSASAGETQMLYHCNFGAPLLGAGAEVVMPSSRIVPRNDWAAEGIGHWSTYQAPTPAMPERVYFHALFADDNRQTLAILRDAKSSHGVALEWNVDQLPYFSLWKNETGLEDGYVTGLEPGTNFPNPRTFEGEHGRVVQLAPGATHTMKLGFTYLENNDAVKQAESRVETIRGGRPVEIADKPTADWCA